MSYELLVISYELLVMEYATVNNLNNLHKLKI